MGRGQGNFLSLICVRQVSEKSKWADRTPSGLIFDFYLSGNFRKRPEETTNYSVANTNHNPHFLLIQALCLYFGNSTPPHKTLPIDHFLLIKDFQNPEASLPVLPSSNPPPIFPCKCWIPSLISLSSPITSLSTLTCERKHCNISSQVSCCLSARELVE